MPVLPLMPGGADQMASPMPGGPPGGAYPPASPTGPGPGGDLASLLGVGGTPAMGGVDPIQGALSQFDMLAQMISDLARSLPQTAQMASQMMEVLDAWRQQTLVSLTPQPSSMPGADMMM